jgi:hypothetical protein
LATESLYLKLNKDFVVNRNLGGLDPVWDKVMVKFKDGRERRTVGRPSQARRYQKRSRSNALGQEKEREGKNMCVS